MADSPSIAHATGGEPIIVTLGLRDDDQAAFERLRVHHFPPARNLVPAHVTLFHHLPGLELDAIRREVQLACAGKARFNVAVCGLRSLGRGVAFVLESADLAGVRAGLASIWAEWLTPQDRQGFRPHVTIQNKAAPEQARALLQAMQAGFQPFVVRAESLLLWRYMGGGWSALGGFEFGSGMPVLVPSNAGFERR